MSLATHIRTLGRGPGRSRSLSREEARDAMEIILSKKAAPEAVGALLMLMRYRGETAPEIAGFTDALRVGVQDWTGLPVALDWPSYAAGRTRGAPLFLLAAKLVALAGYPVLLHGWNSHQQAVASVRAGLADLGIARAHTPAEAKALLQRDAIAYVAAETLHVPALDLLRLRDDLGLRSCLNTVLRMLNPADAPAMVQGVFHPSYRDLQSDAADILGQPSLSVIKGGGGEFERHPGKALTLMGLRKGTRFETVVPELIDASRRLHEPTLHPVCLAALWHGEQDDPFASACVIGTATLALMTCGLDADKAREAAHDLWACRSVRSAA
ncbi:glycosyl transferase family protein [Tropicibacter sp. R16_0]|uniref:glycosyl transferase family protein n=1 Tax=Tropicibacter sp. R16_0 TaxID=2821102 RepID=UPI001ADCC3FE|nr:glycosyl transferase family protein [Tropicibacter sp. R16_0]MBO9451294.1 glycosyl transferase family protein [Tropicibacter sp. R16_0]